MMVSVELLRRYPFFAGLNQKELVSLSQAANLMHFDIDQPIFHEGDELDTFYLVVEGLVGIVVGITDHDQEQKVADQLMGNFNMKGLTVSTVNGGNVFGWSALVPPHHSTAGAKALSPCRILAFNCEQLRPQFNKDPRFAYMMLLKAARIIRDRLRDRRVESLAERVM
jgi:CRP-like cAMP-binding protein